MRFFEINVKMYKMFYFDQKIVINEKKIKIKNDKKMTISFYDLLFGIY